MFSDEYDSYSIKPLFLAPMAGITDQPFRRLCKQFGADILITEMISSRGIFYGDEKTKKMLSVTDGEHPIGVQLFGNQPKIFFEAVNMIGYMPFDFININMGCPTPKIVKNGDGCALMNEHQLSSDIIKSTVRASKGKPVTVKIRKGWDGLNINAVQFAQMAEESGAKLIIVHGRTREEYYSGKADWDIIKDVKRAVSVSVIGNGDIFEPEDAASMLKQTRCDGIMVGRGALGRPWVFGQIKHYLKTGEKISPPSLEERLHIIMSHIDDAVAFHGQHLGILEMRKHLAWYLKGLPHSAHIKRVIQESSSINDIKQTLDSYFSDISDLEVKTDI